MHEIQTNPDTVKVLLRLLKNTFLIQSNDIFLVGILQPEQLITIVVLCQLLFKLLDSKLSIILLTWLAKIFFGTLKDGTTIFWLCVLKWTGCTPSSLGYLCYSWAYIHVITKVVIDPHTFTMGNSV
ncbi:hypothetical protein V8G54_023138 [Vigna mungo]|uniref:Uncharacterized protein n=1 Tax=Vigna mungo TaxID=3915 RepID=A0AAQ3N4J3_VIGMU